MSEATVEKVAYVQGARQNLKRVACVKLFRVLLQAVRRLREAVDRGSAYEGLQTAKSVYHRCRSKRQYEASYDLAQV